MDAEQAWLTGPAGATAAGYRAVQQDIAVTVLDHAGRQLATADWPAPTDVSADRSLSGMGWRRVGPWERDWLGRRAAPVTPVRSLPRQADR